MAPTMMKRGLLAVGGLALAAAVAGCGSASSGSPSSSSAPTSSSAGSSSGQGAASSWMSYQAASKTVTLKLVAGYNSNLSGFNFDGYGKGQMVVSVPSGWKVTVDFSNQGQLPHSAAVVLNANSLAPVFPGAGLPTADLGTGLGPGTTATFSFTAGAPGTYRIACLVPGHEGLGMWDTFRVTSGGTPSIKT